MLACFWGFFSVVFLGGVFWSTPVPCLGTDQMVPEKIFSMMHLLEILLMVAAHEYERPCNT